MSTSTAAAPVPDWLQRVADTSHEDMPLVRRLAGAPLGRQSAVLMLFGPGDGAGPDVVLTERSSTLRRHAGQVSFPGGVVDDTDADLVAAAMREAREEIDLAPDGVRVVGELPRLPLSVTGYSVTPVLAWWERPSTIRAVDPAEVARVVQIPVAALVDPAHRFTATHPSRAFKAPAFEVGDVYVWGFTAIVLAETLDLAGLTRPWDVEDERVVPERFMRR
ncbi:NUDIX hydrolase [Luteipulveratus flavus]|uniref:CoA pyrophosphatase n=1 Tax=Luteipulveratus flavus TaxID=3031728 RepID=A0ABT6C793_9MICO|nr:CoA pyrophosphatase [Luteipulveratus sp. YIM 133296]MDF8264813.1 CoA pyrophosphatase [Luteipulveratus sp. YIM 133296]